MGYGLLIQLCILALLAKGVSAYRWNIYWPALFSVVGPVLVFMATSIIAGRADMQLLSLANIVTMACQYGVALVVFNFLTFYDDTIAVWLMWLMGGGAVMYILVPALVELF